MGINKRHLVLWVIDAVEGRPNGRTYLQKMCFFVGQILDLDLGYRAHYYGPYSDLISAEVGFLTANGYAFESRKRSGIADTRGWEVTRCDYELTERGREGVAWLDANFAEHARRVREAVAKILAAGELNYVGLSYAAKTFWILRNQGQEMTPDRIAKKASEFKWNVEAEDVRKAGDFLEHLRLATVSGA